MQETWVRFLGQEDLGLILGSGRSPGEGSGNSLQYTCLENPTDGGAWQTTVHSVTKSQTQLNDFIFTFIQLYTLTSFYINICLAYSKVCTVACSFYLLTRLSRVYHMLGPLLGTGLNKMDVAALPSWRTLWSPYVVHPLWVCNLSSQRAC